MNFFGIGPMEIAVVFLVAFLAFGPGKSIEMARTIGKVMRDLRRTFEEVTSAVNLDGDDNRPAPRPDSRPPAPPASPGLPGPADSPPQNQPPPPTRNE